MIRIQFDREKLKEGLKRAGQPFTPGGLAVADSTQRQANKRDTRLRLKQHERRLVDRRRKKFLTKQRSITAGRTRRSI